MRKTFIFVVCYRDSHTRTEARGATLPPRGATLPTWQTPQRALARATVKNSNHKQWALVEPWFVGDAKYARWVLVLCLCSLSSGIESQTALQGDNGLHETGFWAPVIFGRV